MNARLVAALSALCILAVLSVLAVSMGLVPALDPELARTERLDLARAVDTRREPAQPVERAAPTLALERFPLCRPPAQGARAFRVLLGSEREGLMVFCQGGYELFSFELGSVPVRARRVARFQTRAALPGGAAGGDFDGDGVFDLALGLAPRLGVLHESGAGAFWVRGRREGGYEAPRTLAETATQAMASLDLDGAPPVDLLVLTRGDVAAQRPGELWTFTKGPLLARQRVVPTGLEPRDLLARASDTGAALWVVTGQPGALLGVSLPRDPAQKPSLERVALPGAQALVSGPGSEGLPLVRTPSALLAVQPDAPLSVKPWASDANVGPALFSPRAQAGADGERVLGALAHGIAELAAGSDTVRDELAFGDETRVHDLVLLTQSQGPRRVVALIESEGELAALIVPPPPWEASAVLRIEPRAVEDAHGFADVPLD